MKRIWILLGFFLLPVTAASQVHEATNIDPLEPMNRITYRMNDALDRTLMTPAAKLYMAVTPNVVEHHITLFFANLGGLTSIANSFAQFKIDKGFRHIGRFTLNSTIGLFGFFDVASDMGLRATPEDFGQTLAVWGVPSGPYLVLPLFGPSTVRDAGGMAIDTFSDPVTYYPEASIPNVAVRSLDLVSTRAGLFKYESMLSGDRYQMLRDLYLQSRIYDIQEGNVVDTFADTETNEDSEFLDESF